MQYLFLFKTFIKIGMKEYFLNLIKVIYEKSVTVITITELSPGVDSIRVSCSLQLTQHFTGDSQ